VEKSRRTFCLSSRQKPLELHRSRTQSNKRTRMAQKLLSRAVEMYASVPHDSRRTKGQSAAGRSGPLGAWGRDVWGLAGALIVRSARVFRVAGAWCCVGRRCGEALHLRHVAYEFSWPFYRALHRMAVHLSSHAPTPPGDQGSGTANSALAATATECSTWNNRTSNIKKQRGLCAFDPDAKL
jgi:hypothetical protein